MPAKAKPAKPAKPSKPADPPVRFASQRAFEAWLARHGQTSDGIWLEIAKAGAPAPTVTYPEAIDSALIHGWIDGQKRALDATHWLQRFTPRRPRSLWSKINRDKIAALIAAGRMKPAGLAEVERARADGRWDAAYDGARTAEVPDDLRAALDADPAAAKCFAGLDGRNRYAVLWRVQTAKLPATRARRIAQLVAMLAAGETLH
jgi:uncharacterized protein YdeI (YjbR/CyaY-like superfamily)